jgi:ABC-type multidrug transport system ATPase subunit
VSPTQTGLDARAAAIVMSAVRNVASSGRTVMVTIHQPSIEIFEAFDTLLLLQVWHWQGWLRLLQ